MAKKKFKPLIVPADVQEEFKASLDQYEDGLVEGIVAAAQTQKKTNYRKHAFAHYEQLGQIVCVHCGFGIRDVLEVAHLDGDRSNNHVSNLVILCPTCHRMHDLDLIPTKTIIEMRDRPKIVVQAKRMKNAGEKAAKTRRDRLKWKAAGEKAAETRKRNAAQKEDKKPL